MIKSLRLQDFQSHKDSTFEFSPNLSVIVGSSNQGKTSLVRAFSLLLYNQWDSSWCRVGASFSRITLTIDSGIIVIREKGPKTNKYILQIPNQEDQIYENFGINVPDAVSKILNIRKIELDKDDSLALNMSFQLDNLFMFNRSGSQKAKVFGRLSGAQYLDHALRNLSIEKKQISVEKNLKEKEMVELQTQHTNLSKIYDFAPTIMRFIVADSKIEENRQRLGGIKSLLQRTQDWKRRYTSESNHEAVLSKAGHVELTLIEASVQRLKQLKQLLLWKRDLEGTNTTLNSIKQQLENEFNAAIEEYTRILEQSSLCPVCFTVLDTVKMQEIKQNLIGVEKCSI